MKRLLNVILAGVILVAFATTASAYSITTFGKGLDLYQAKDYHGAIEKLTEAIKSNDKNAKAYFYLAESHRHLGQVDQTLENYKKAYKHDKSYGKEIAKNVLEFGKAFGDNRMYGTAEKYFLIAANYDSGVKPWICDYLIDKAKTNFYIFRYARHFTYNQETAIHVGKGILRYAVDVKDDLREELKAEAAPLVGWELVRKVFPDPKEVATFEKTFTFDDAHDKEYGQFYAFTFGVEDVKVGDSIEVVVRVLSGDILGGSEVGIYRGINSVPEWDETKNGYYKSIVEAVNNGKKFMISFGERKDLEVLVRVTRIISFEPNKILVANL